MYALIKYVGPCDDNPQVPAASHDEPDDLVILVMYHLKCKLPHPTTSCSYLFCIWLGHELKNISQRSTSNDVIGASFLCSYGRRLKWLYHCQKDCAAQGSCLLSLDCLIAGWSLMLQIRLYDISVSAVVCRSAGRCYYHVRG